MTLSASTLATQLQAKIANTDTPTTAINSIADAFDAYISAAAGNSIPLTRPATAKSDMKTAMAALNTSGQGATAIAAGVQKYWDDIVSFHDTAFPTSTAATEPSGLATLAASLQATFDANAAVNLTGKTQPEIDAAVVMMLTNIANTIHAACIGPTPGTVTVPPGTIGPIT